MKRRPEIESEKTSSMVRNRGGTSGRSSRRMPRVAAATDAGSPPRIEHHRVIGGRALGCVDVNRRSGFRVEPGLQNVSHDPDHAQQAQVTIHVSKLDELPDRVFALPLFLHQSLAHERDVRGVRGVGGLEEPSADERNSHRLEETLARGSVLRGTGLRGILRQASEVLVALDFVERVDDEKGPVADAGGKREHVDQTRPPNARESPEPREDFALGLSEPFLLALVRGVGVGEIDDERARSPEAGVDVEKAYETSREETRAHEEDERERDSERRRDRSSTSRGALPLLRPPAPGDGFRGRSRFVSIEAQ